MLEDSHGLLATPVLSVIAVKVCQFAKPVNQSFHCRDCNCRICFKTNT